MGAFSDLFFFVIRFHCKRKSFLKPSASRLENKDKEYFHHLKNQIKKHPSYLKPVSSSTKEETALDLRSELVEVKILSTLEYLQQHVLNLSEKLDDLEKQEKEKTNGNTLLA